MPANATTSINSGPRKLRQPMNVVAVYLLSLATCVLGYFAYVRFVVPLVELPVQKIQSVANNRTELLIPKIDKSILIPLLPAGAWELKDCKILVTSSGTVLFNEIEPQQDGTLKLSPFTLITGVGDDLLLADSTATSTEEKKIPLALRTPDGATLTLDKPITEAIHSGAKIESARLLGEVDIYRPPSAPNHSDALYVLARNVQFDKHRIYTLDTLNDPVLFSYGPHKGKGRNLRIDLLHRTDTVTGREDFSTIDGASKLELAYLDQLRIVPSENPNNGNAPSEPAGVFAGGNSPLEISCKGPCLFDFIEQTVLLSDRVNVTRIDEHRDNLACSQLKIRFEKRPAENSIDEKLQLVDLVALGNPVVVNANSRPAKISADRLTYNAITDEFFGVADPAGNQHVTLVTPDIQYRTAQLRCRLATNSANKKTLESLDAQGPGQLLKIGKKPDEELFAKWSKSLSVKPSRDQPGAQILIVQGDTHIQFHQNSEIDAQRIDIKLMQTEVADGKSEFAVAEIVASQAVHIVTPELDGTTERLTASFPNPVSLKSHRVSRPVYQATFTRQNNGSATNRTRTETAQPSAQITSDPANPPSKLLRFTGGQVHVTVVPGDAEKLSFADLEIIDEVKVSQVDLKQPQSPPSLKVNGDYLRIVPQSSDKKYRLELITNEVSADKQFRNVETPDFSLVGQKINLDQTANKIWVDGPGRIKFKDTTEPVSPQNSRPQGGFANRSTNNTSAQTPSSMNATWLGGMIFDGQKLYFERDVNLAANQSTTSNESNATGQSTPNRQQPKNRQQLIQANCGQMSVALNRFVNFENLKGQNARRDEIKPTEIIFVNQVDPSKQVFAATQTAVAGQPKEMRILVQNFDAMGTLQQQQSISGDRVTIDPISKNILANGPGWVSTHDLQKTATASTSATRNPLARFSAPNPSGTAKPISFVRVNFAGDLKIDGATNQMDIVDRVRTLYMTTDDWRLNIDPDRIPATARQAAVLLTSQQMTLARWKPREANEEQHELTAKGNVRIRGDSIDLNSDRVSYNQINDMLVVNGTTRTPAKIRYRQLPGRSSAATGWQEFSAEKFKYQVATQSISVDGVKKVKGTGAIRLN